MAIVLAESPSVRIIVHWLIWEFLPIGVVQLSESDYLLTPIGLLRLSVGSLMPENSPVW
jgi:hypothetical protein